MRTKRIIIVILLQFLLLKCFTMNLYHTTINFQIDSIPNAIYTIVKIEVVNNTYIYYATNGDKKYRIIATGIKKHFFKRKIVKLGDKYELVLFPYSEFDTLELSTVTHLQINNALILIHEWDWILCSSSKFASKYYIASNHNH
jgi:hypothetical protein